MSMSHESSNVKVFERMSSSIKVICSLAIGCRSPCAMFQLRFSFAREIAFREMSMPSRESLGM